MADSSSSLVPAMPPPAGQTSNFNIHTELQSHFMAVYIALLVLAACFVGLRLYTRLVITKSPGADDLFTIFAWLFSAAQLGICINWMQYGFAKHLWDTPATALPMYLKLLIPIVIFYCWAPMCTKLSILILYIRLSPNKWFRTLVGCIMFFVIGYTLGVTFVVSAGCSPLDSTKGACLDSLGLWQGILNIASDVVMLLLPIPLLWHLQIPIVQKLGVGLIFSLGSLVLIISIVRLRYIEDLSSSPDVTWTEGNAYVWSAIETNIGIVCACLTVLKPLARRYWPGSLTTFGNSHGAGASGGEVESSNVFSLRSRPKARSYSLGSHDVERVGVHVPKFHPDGNGKDVESESTRNIVDDE